MNNKHEEYPRNYDVAFKLVRDEHYNNTPIGLKHCATHDLIELSHGVLTGNARLKLGHYYLTPFHQYAETNQIKCSGYNSHSWMSGLKDPSCCSVDTLWHHHHTSQYDGNIVACTGSNDLFWVDAGRKKSLPTSFNMSLLTEKPIVYLSSDVLATIPLLLSHS